MSFQPGDRFHLHGHPELTGTVYNLSDNPQLIYVVWDHRADGGSSPYITGLIVKIDEPDSNVPEEW